ncbi:MAG: hypothetical protein MJE68_07350 [Proteobacteria bacterium]|nr:hypothetical protein [Pseudomonadota bacterium]
MGFQGRPGIPSTVEAYRSLKAYFAFVTSVSLRRRRQRLVERFFGMNMTKTQL